LPSPRLRHACKVFVHKIDRRQAARGNLRGQFLDGTKAMPATSADLFAMFAVADGRHWHGKISSLHGKLVKE
jgi:hypothetical protein